MIEGNFLKSTAIRLAIIYISLFVIADLGANVAAYQMVVRFLDDRLNANVMERFREIQSAYDARGLGGAIQMIDSHGPVIRGQETVYTLWGPGRPLIAGNAKLSNVPAGFDLNPRTRRKAPPITSFSGERRKQLVVGISYMI